MRFFLDANMPRLAVSALTRLGHQIEFARDIGMANDSDESISAHALATQAALVTRDLDFADVRNYPPERYFGIVVIRLPDDATAVDISSVLERFARNDDFTGRLSGKLAVLEESRVRFRPPLG
jgi:predicted nuclease of predicted toxin-antitoxin system